MKYKTLATRVLATGRVTIVLRNSHIVKTDEVSNLVQNACNASLKQTNKRKN